MNRFYISNYSLDDVTGGAELLGENLSTAMNLKYLSGRRLGIDITNKGRMQISQEMDDALSGFESDITVFNSTNCWSRRPNTKMSVAVCAENFEEEANCMKDDRWRESKMHESTYQVHSLENADKIITITNGERTALKMNHDFDSTVIEPYVDLDIFKPNHELSKNAHLMEFGALFVGRIHNRKGFDAVKSAADSFPDINFHCVVGKNHIDDNIIMHDYLSREQLAQFYNMASFLIMPSRYESFGYIYAEALACNTPIISTKVGLFKEIDDELSKVNVILIDTPEDANEAIREFLNKKNYPEVRGNMMNRKIAERRFSESRFAKDCGDFLGKS